MNYTITPDLCDGDFSVSVSSDMNYMHLKYKFQDAVDKLDKDKLKEFLDFRFKFLTEELNEGLKAVSEQNPEEIVDSLIDLVVIAVGTCDLFGIDFDKAWNKVLVCNLNKEVGVKSTRPSLLGIDLIKPTRWTGPDHSDNHGKLKELFT